MAGLFIISPGSTPWEEEKQEEAKPKKPAKGTPLTSMSISQLNDLLQEALGQENYEKAAAIRDEMKKREGGGN